MNYTRALIYDPEGNFVGYSILKNGINKLHSSNIWTEAESGELDKQLNRLNGDVAIKAHWPRVDDPEVIALLENSAWEPIETMLAEVVDEDRSYYVWLKDASGHNTADLDKTASVIATKQAQVPVRPSDISVRVRHALETVAERRAGL